MLFLLSLPRLSSRSFAAGRIGLLQACPRGSVRDSAARLHHCPLTLLVPFPLLRNIPRFAHVKKPRLSSCSFRHCFYFYSSHLFLNPLFPKSRNLHSMSSGVSNKSVLCFRNSLSVLSLCSVLGFPSRSILCPFS